MGGCSGISISDATSTAIGAGQANTTAIVNGCTESGTAARICDDLVLGGFNDWYLPSKDELNLLYLLKTVVGGFADTYYWSSTECAAYSAWWQKFSDGLQLCGAPPADKNASTDRVRAIRSF
jgi:hypothetical protein